MSDVETDQEGQEIVEIKEIDKQPTEDKELPSVSEAEVKALQKGWQTKEDWKESGKDPDEWISANHFNKNGDVYSQMQRLKKNASASDQRIADNNALWKTQLDMQKEELLEQRDEAIDDADKDQVKKLDGQIDRLKEQSAKLEALQIPPVSPEDTAIEQTYYDSLDITHRDYANQATTYYVNKFGLSGEELVKYVSQAVNKQYPPITPINPRRDKASVTDTSKRSSKAGDGKITVDNLTRDEKSVMQSMRNINVKYAKMSDAQMIKILQDSKL